MSRIDQAIARAARSGVQGERPGAAGVDLSSPWDVKSTELSPPEDDQTRATAEPDASAHLPAEDAALPLDRTRAAGRGVLEVPLAAPRLAEDVIEKMVVAAGADARSVEQYRRSAALLHLTQAERGIKIVLVASAEQGEGKTLTATNVALTLSESYRRSVLLIDADLRRPAIHNLFQIPNVTGLTDGLKSTTDRIPLVQYSDCLSILPAGKPDRDPMSALTSERMQRVLAEGSSAFDWVVLDTPPVGLLPDAHLLAAMADTVLLVVEAGRTRCVSVQRAINALGHQRILGVILNRIEGAPEAEQDPYYRYVQPPMGSGRWSPAATAATLLRPWRSS